MRWNDGISTEFEIFFFFGRHFRVFCAGFKRHVEFSLIIELDFEVNAIGNSMKEITNKQIINRFPAQSIHFLTKIN